MRIIRIEWSNAPNSDWKFGKRKKSNMKSKEEERRYEEERH